MTKEQLESRIKTQNSSIEWWIKVNKEDQTRLRKRNNTITTLRTENGNLAQRLTETDSQIYTLNRRIDDFDQSYQTLKDKNAQYVDRNNDLLIESDTVQAMQKDLRENHKTVEILEAEVKSLTDANEKLNNKVNRHYQDRQDTEEAIKFAINHVYEAIGYHTS